MGRGGCFYLEVRAGDTGCDLLEKRLLDPDKLGWLDHVQDLLDLAEKHHLDVKTQYGSRTRLAKNKEKHFEGS